MHIENRQSKKINIVLISDRLAAQAVELSNYIRTFINSFNVLGIASNIREAILSSKDQSVDFLIIVCYLKNENSYYGITELLKHQNALIPVHWAIIDELIVYLCSKHNIRLMFDRTLPKQDFILFLQEQKRI